MRISEGFLPVSGATLHYRVAEPDDADASTPPVPALLLLQGGDGDADGMAALTSLLAERFRVITYDRRGLSRSRIGDPTAPVDLGVHAEDAAALLAALTDAPALAFGGSLGALLGLELLFRYPQRVAVLIAHEPPATQFLPPAERDAATAEQARVEDIFATQGLPAAMRAFMATTAIDPTDREGDVEIPRPDPARAANLHFFLTHDAPAVRRHRLNLAALTAYADQVIPAAGLTSSSGFPHRCAQELGAALGREVVIFPGGHNGYILRPRAFAQQLTDLLEAITPSGG
jgi:pimeloyl-ACP methyl ester carboxylesterase